MGSIVGIDERMALILGAGFLSCLLFLTLAIVLSHSAGPRLRLNRRLRNLGLSTSQRETVSNRTMNPRQKRIQQKLQDLENRKKKKGAKNDIQSAMLKAGLESNVRAYLFGSVLVSVISMGVVYILAMPWYVILASGLFTAYFLPKWVLLILFNKRQKRFTANFPDALDIIIRGVRSGLPVAECLNIVSREIPDPVGDEFSRLVEGQKIGLTVPELLQRGLERMPTKEYKFFAVVIQIQQETGGNLADTLENLSTVLRERKQMRDKAVALASEATASAAIIGSLPILVGGALAFLSWEYMEVLFTTDTGHLLIGGGLGWMALGILVMRNMINFKT